MNTRQQDIITLTEKYGEITIKALAKMLDVTEMTIHRDLDYLQSENLIHKKRGAAVFSESTQLNSIAFYTEEKRAIGKAAAALIQPGEGVIFDNSTTAIECARFLDTDKKLTCYTTNLEVSQIISKNKNHVLYCSGGYYFPDSNGFLGQHAEQFVASVCADVAIIGASGISLDAGITNPYPMHNTLQNKIIQSAKRTVLVADHSKFDRVAMEKTCGLSCIDTIITDDGISDEILKKYQKHINIIIAKKE